MGDAPELSLLCWQAPLVSPAWQAGSCGPQAGATGRWAPAGRQPVAGSGRPPGPGRGQAGKAWAGVAEKGTTLCRL